MGAVLLKKADRTRKQLLDAALRVISRKGYSSATVDEIVREAGVSKGVAYYHFKNKAAIAEDILDRELGRLADEFAQIADEAPNSSEALTTMLESFAANLYDHREFARFFMTELWREGRVWSHEMRDKTQSLVDVVAAQFARGQKEGVVRAEVDPTFEAVAIVGMVLTTTMYYVGQEEEPQLSRKEFVQRIYDFARRSAVESALLQ